MATILPDNYAAHTTGRVSIRYKATQTPGYKFVGMFWPSEIVALQGLCADAQGGTYSVSLAGPDRGDGYWAQPNLWVPLR